MNNAPAFDLGKFIPGFEFLQKLATQRSGAAGPAPGLAGWVAPTVSVGELDRRVKELKAVQFWLEQNTTAIKATVQALEVQKMTLATLEGMNLSMAEVAKAFTLPTQQGAAPAAAPAAAERAAERTSGQWPYGADAPAPAAAPAPASAPEPEPAPPQNAAPAEPPAAPPAAAGMADPMAWWGALTQQFQQIAASAVREAAQVMPESLGSAARAPAAAGAPSAKPRGKAAARPAAKKTPGRQRANAKPAAPKSRAPAAKTAAQSKAPSSAKAATGAARQSATKPGGKRPPAAKAEAPRAGTGWPLPPPFKFGR